MLAVDLNQILSTYCLSGPKGPELQLKAIQVSSILDVVYHTGMFFKLFYNLLCFPCDTTENTIMLKYVAARRRHERQRDSPGN